MLRNLEFSDIYVEDKGVARYKRPKEVNSTPVPNEYAADIREIYELCQTTERLRQASNFSVVQDGESYRVSKMNSVGGIVYVLRRNPSSIPSLGSLGIPEIYLQNLMRPKLTGAIIVCGPTHSGKTWTVSSIVKERLLRYGGVAITAEEPPEMPLHGSHDKGQCYQTEVDMSAGGYALSVRSMMRQNPGIMYLGEILDGETASEVLNASINGHLIFSTVHADSVETMFHRISALAKKVVGEGSNQLLADGIAAVLHQRLDGGKLICQFLMVDSEATKKKIRDGKFEMLSQELEEWETRAASWIAE